LISRVKALRLILYKLTYCGETMLNELQQNSGRFLVERPSIAQNQVSPMVVATLASDEFDELIAELATGGSREAVVAEFTDVLNYLAQLAKMLEIDESEVLARSKYTYEVRNYRKYPPEDDGKVSRQNQIAFWEQNQKYLGSEQTPGDYY